MEVPVGFLATLWSFISFLPFFVLLFAHGLLKGTILSLRKLWSILDFEDNPEITWMFSVYPSLGFFSFFISCLDREKLVHIPIWVKMEFVNIEMKLVL